MNKIENYQEKKDWLWKFQGGTEQIPAICTGCGKLMLGNYKIDLAHNLAKTKWNFKNYPLFINSLLNLSLQDNGCNVERRQPRYDNNTKYYLLCCNYLDKIGEDVYDESISVIYRKKYNLGFNYANVFIFETYLKEHPGFAKFINCEV